MRTKRLMLILVLMAVGPAHAMALDQAPRGPRPSFDIRASDTARVPPTPAQLAALAALPGATARWDESRGVPTVILRHGGYLSGPNTDARAFLRSLAPLMGMTPREASDLVQTYEYTTRHNGARHLEFRQFHRGRPVHGSIIKITLDREGRIVLVGGSFFSGLAVEGASTLSAADAVEAAARAIDARPAQPPRPLRRESGPARPRASSGPSEPIVFENTVARRLKAPSEITAEMVVFPMPPGQAARAGWKVVIEADSGWYEMVIDARSGDLLYRSGDASLAPQGTVFTVQNPTLGSPQIVSFAGAAFDNAGWVTDRATAGNNASAYTDLDNDDLPDYQTQTPASGDPNYQHFDYTFTDAYVTSGGTDVMTDRDAAVTQAFYRVNWLHDYFYVLGFDEPARNFQEDNFGRGGLGGDSMLVEVHNDFDSNPNPESPNTQSPPDGQKARMELHTGIVGQRHGRRPRHARVHARGFEPHRRQWGVPLRSADLGAGRGLE